MVPGVAGVAGFTGVTGIAGVTGVAGMAGVASVAGVEASAPLRAEARASQETQQRRAPPPFRTLDLAITECFAQWRLVKPDGWINQIAKRGRFCAAVQAA